MAIYRIRKDDLENQLNKSALWAITYGDLMSYLMIFFLLLFAFSIAKSDKNKLKKYEESLVKIQQTFGGKITQEYLDKKTQELKEENFEKKLQEIQKKEASNMLEVEMNEKRIKLILKEGILFDSGSAILKPQAQNILLPVIEELKKLNNDIIIEGHTDNVPIKSGRYATNFELSMARAYSVIEFMEKSGIDPKRLSGIGYGEWRPIADNSTPDGRARNRRIEITLIKKE
ncbi:MAG: flagellar motor protein MotB [Elusimicrobiales bacterium]|nr:flagellar motor protein MotB [Elusimicrobiales bacterium]